MTTVISKTTKELRHQEGIIQDGMKSFLHVGRALLAIRDGELYDEGYETFEAYLKKRWNFGTRRANQLMASAEVVAEIGTTVPISGLPLPDNERQTRVLIESADTPEERAEVWAAAVAAAPKNEHGAPVVTAKIVKAAAEELLGPAPPKPPKEKTDPKPEPSGKPSGGTSFDPSEFDPDVEPEDRQSSSDDPKHLTDVLAGMKQFKSLQREVSLLYGKVEAVSKLPVGSYIQLQEVQQHINQVKADLKAYSFGDNCPTCKNKPAKTCPKCKGRGWLAHSQMGQLSDIDKDWLKANSVKA